MSTNHKEPRTVVLTPIYKPTLSENERIALQHSFSVLKSHDIVFMAPQKLDLSYYHRHFPGIRYAFYPDECFLSTQTYSDLLTSVDFYEGYSGYTHMLIVQSDCIVFRDDLQYWTSSPFDYVGAPWAQIWNLQVPQLGTAFDGMKFSMNVGNGGLSLRRIAACINLIDECRWIKNNYREAVEDAFFAFGGEVSCNFLIPNAVHAARFSIEKEPRSYLSVTKQIPMGTHAWEKWDKALWLEVFRQQGICGLT